jgi:GNAT superfamily N-acetyltransferase
MSSRWPVQAKRRHGLRHNVPLMHATYGQGVTIRRLRNGDTETVLALFARLGDRARETRFCGAKPRLGEAELALLARVDSIHHVLVGHVAGHTEPAGIARLVRNGAQAEIAVGVADAHRGKGVGTALLEALAADARAAGITSFRATVCGDNEPALGLLRKLSASLEVTWRWGEREVVVPLRT